MSFQVIPVPSFGAEDVVVGTQGPDEGAVFTGTEDGVIYRITPDGQRIDRVAETGVRLESGLELFGRFDVHHDHNDSDDEFCVYVMRTELSDDDIECNEGRQIVFVDPDRVRDGSLELSPSTRYLVPRFLESDTYARLTSFDG